MFLSCMLCCPAQNFIPSGSVWKQQVADLLEMSALALTVFVVIQFQMIAYKIAVCIANAK